MDKHFATSSLRYRPFSTISLISGLLLLACYIRPSSAGCTAMNYGDNVRMPSITCDATNWAIGGIPHEWTVQTTDDLRILVQTRSNSMGWTVTATDASNDAMAMVTRTSSFLSEGPSIYLAVNHLPPPPSPDMLVIDATAVFVNGVINISDTTNCAIEIQSKWKDDGYAGKNTGHSGSKTYTCSSTMSTQLNFQAGDRLLLSFKYKYTPRMHSTLPAVSGEVSVLCREMSSMNVLPPAGAEAGGVLTILCTKLTAGDSLLITFSASGEFEVHVSEVTGHVVFYRPGNTTIVATPVETTVTPEKGITTPSIQTSTTTSASTGTRNENTQRVSTPGETTVTPEKGITTPPTSTSIAISTPTAISTSTAPSNKTTQRVSTPGGTTKGITPTSTSTSTGAPSKEETQGDPFGVFVPVVIVLVVVVIVLVVVIACFVYRYRRKHKSPNQTGGPGMALHPTSPLHGRGSAQQHEYEETDDRRGGSNRDSKVYAEIQDRDDNKDGKELPGKNHGKPLGSGPAPPAPRGGARYQDVLAPGGRPVVGALQDSQATSEMHTYEGLQNPDAKYTSLLPDLVLNGNKTSKPMGDERGKDNDVYNEIDEQNYNVLDSGKEVSGYHEYNVPDENHGRSKQSPKKPRANNINTSGPYQALGTPDVKTSNINSRAGTNGREQAGMHEHAPTGRSGLGGSENHAYQDLRQDNDNYTPLRTGDAGSDTQNTNQGFRQDEASPGSDYLGLKKEEPNYAVLESSDPERSEYESPRKDQDSGDYLSPSDSQVSRKDDYAKPMPKPLSTNQSDESKNGAGYTSLQLDNQGPNSTVLDPDDYQVPESAKAASPRSTGDEHDDYMDPVQADTRTQSEGPYDHLQHQKMNYVKPSQAHFAGNQSDGSNLDAGYGALILDSQSPGAAVQKPSGSNDNYASLQATGDDHDDYMDPVRETPASEGPYDHLQHQRITS